MNKERSLEPVSQSDLLDILKSVQEELEIRRQEEIEVRRKEFKPGYFKYDNGYSAENRWWMYIHTLAMTSENRLEVFMFQKTSDNKISFETDNHHYNFYNFEDNLYIPISEEEFDVERLKLIKEVLSLY